MNCSKPHADLPASVRALPESQRAIAGRHICAACAYELGRDHARAAEENLRLRVQELKAEVARLEAAKK